jgi:hypothetical protein
MIGGCGPCPFFSYTLAFTLQLRKSTENLSQGSSYIGVPWTGLANRESETIGEEWGQWQMGWRSKEKRQRCSEIG